VELVRACQGFGFYHADAEKFVTRSNGHIVIDDGRRYLTVRKKSTSSWWTAAAREAAGSSLLFSTDFTRWPSSI